MNVRVFAAAFAVALSAHAADAQQQRPASPAGGQTVRYFSFYSDFLGELPAEGFLRETRQGGRVVSAVLDICYSVAPSSNRKDRFVVNLTADGNRLSGQGQSQEGKVAVAVNLTRRFANGAASFEGTVKRGNDEFAVDSSDNPEVTEQDFQDAQDASSPAAQQPADDAEASPDSLFVRVKRDALGALLNELRAQRVRVHVGGLAADCAALRFGEQLIFIEVDPMRAGALVEKLKAFSGVVATGGRPGSYAIENAVLLNAADWQAAGGALDREKLANAAGAAAAKAMSARFDGATADQTTGAIRLTLKRPSTGLPNLDLTDDIRVTVVAGPEKPGASGLVLWMGDADIETIDEGSGARVAIRQSADEEGGAGDLETIDKAQLAAAIARELKGRSWDSEAGAWKK